MTDPVARAAPAAALPPAQPLPYSSAPTDNHTRPRPTTLGGNPTRQSAIINEFRTGMHRPSLDKK